jgi:hypothetical protein
VKCFILHVFFRSQHEHFSWVWRTTSIVHYLHKVRTTVHQREYMPSRPILWRRRSETSVHRTNGGRQTADLLSLKPVALWPDFLLLLLLFLLCFNPFELVFIWRPLLQAIPRLVIYKAVEQSISSLSSIYPGIMSQLHNAPTSR